MDDAKDEKEFMSYWGKGSLASMQEAEAAFKGQGPALTKGKGQGALTKGKGSKGSKGRGRGVLAIEDGNPNGTEDDKDKKTPEEQWAECLTKAQKSKEHLRVAVGNLEEALEAASQAGRTSKQDRKEAQLTLKHAQEWEQKLKAITNKKKGGNVEAAKQTIKDAVVCTNQVKTEVKEYKALANKSFSKSSKK